MAITPPSNVSYGTVTWRAVVDVADGVDVDSLPDYVAPTGTVTFTASVSKVLDATATPDPLTIIRSSIVAVLDDQGYLCTANADGSAGTRGVKLIATDDPDLNPSGWVWNVTYNLRLGSAGLSLRSHTLDLPSGATRDLSTAIPPDAADAIGIPQAEALAAQAILAAEAAEADAAASAASAAAAAASVTAAAAAAAEAAVVDAEASAADALAAATNAGTAASSASASAASAAASILSSATFVSTTVSDPTTAAHKSVGLVTGFRSVKSYGAVGDGTTDDTTAIQNAINATAAGGTLYFPPGTYSVTSTGTTSILVAVNGITLQGAGNRLSTITVAAANAAARILSVSSRTNIKVADLGFSATANPAPMKAAIYASTVGTQKNIVVTRCKFVDFAPGVGVSGYGAVYFYTSDGIEVSDNEFIGCGRAIVVDQPQEAAHVNIIGNRITATPGASRGVGVMYTGIRINRASGSSESAVLVQGNYVSGATCDPGMNGAEGHGITAYRVRDVRIIGNTCRDNGRGVLVSYQAFGGIVMGNECIANQDAGIRIEPEISGTNVTVGTDVPRGIIVQGNVARNNVGIGTPGPGNSGQGITISYAAGSVVSGNISHNNGADGIMCDSDRVTITGNVCYNNWQNYAPGLGAKGGLRVYTGVGCTITGNQCFDNQTTKTQEYGLSLSGTTTAIVQGNNFSGNSVADIFGPDKIRTGFNGVTPVAKAATPGTATGTDAAVINALTTALRSLGLVT